MRKEGSGALQTVLITVILIAGLAVSAALCARAVSLEREAGALTRAALLAGDASEAFYASKSAEEMAELLGGTASENTIMSENGRGETVTVRLSEKSGFALAEITVTGENGLLTELTCEKEAER